MSLSRRLYETLKTDAERIRANFINGNKKDCAAILDEHKDTPAAIGFLCISVYKLLGKSNGQDFLNWVEYNATGTNGGV